MSTDGSPDAIVGLAVALGIGLLVGIERERRKGDGDRRAAAGASFSGLFVETALKMREPPPDYSWRLIEVAGKSVRS
jgi:hypothetical protein